MKQGKMRYILIAAVLLVWGSILLRLLKTLNGHEREASVPTPAMGGLTRAKADSFVLLANYPDPFLAGDDEDPALPDTARYTPGSASLPAEAPKVPEAAPDVSFIKYAGFLSNPATKIKRAFLNIQGIDYFMKEGDAVNGVRIIRIKPEKIAIAYKNRRFEIKAEAKATAGF